MEVLPGTTLGSTAAGLCASNGNSRPLLWGTGKGADCVGCSGVTHLRYLGAEYAENLLQWEQGLEGQLHLALVSERLCTCICVNRVFPRVLVLFGVE